MSLSPSSLESGGEGGDVFLTLPERIFQNSLEFLSEIWTMLTKLPWNFFCTLKFLNLKYLSLTIALFLLFAVIFAKFFPYSINYVIKPKNILLELNASIMPMSAISETCNHGQSILELVDFLPNVSFTKSETERDYY